jgi:hypothetical protein
MLVHLGIKKVVDVVTRWTHIAAGWRRLAGK